MTYVHICICICIYFYLNKHSFIDLLNYIYLFIDMVLYIAEAFDGCIDMFHFKPHINDWLTTLNRHSIKDKSLMIIYR